LSTTSLPAKEQPEKYDLGTWQSWVSEQEAELLIAFQDQGYGDAIPGLEELPGYENFSVKISLAPFL